MLRPNYDNILNSAFDFIEKYAPIFIKDIPENQSFIKNPDDPNEHKPEWHQFGIITHSHLFAYHYERTLPRYLKMWGLENVINTYLNNRIDGISKNELLHISIPFHDLGKFAGRFFKIKNRQSSAYFDYHEKLSEELVRNNPFVQHFL